MTSSSARLKPAEEPETPSKTPNRLMAVSLPPSLLRRPIAESNQFYFSTWPDRSRACAIREKWYQYQPPTEKSFKYNALTPIQIIGAATHT